MRRHYPTQYNLLHLCSTHIGIRENVARPYIIPTVDLKFIHVTLNNFDFIK